MSGSEICPGCGVKLEIQTADVKHAYIGASGSCWRVYGEILARDYSDREFMKFHRWTVDAYAAQHPGRPEPRAIQSVNVHLVALYLLVEKKCEPASVTAEMAKLIEREKSRFQWLTPPRVMGDVTVLDVLAASTAEAPGAAVKNWASSVWAAWEEHHAVIRALAGERSIASSE